MNPPESLTMQEEVTVTTTPEVDQYPTNLHDANASLRRAVAERESRRAVAPPEAAHAASDVSEDDYATWTKPDQAGLHPDSRRFMELVEELKLLHLSKSMDYGETEEPLANIKNGANFVDIEP